MLDFFEWGGYKFFGSGLVIEKVVGEGFAESFDECLVVFGGVEFFGAEKLACEGVCAELPRAA